MSSEHGWDHQLSSRSTTVLLRRYKRHFWHFPPIGMRGYSPRSLVSQSFSRVLAFCNCTRWSLNPTRSQHGLTLAAAIPTRGSPVACRSLISGWFWLEGWRLLPHWSLAHHQMMPLRFPANFRWPEVCVPALRTASAFNRPPLDQIDPNAPLNHNIRLERSS